MAVKDYSHCKSFDEMGNILFQDTEQGVSIRAGQIFEGQTVKGNTNLIITVRAYNGYIVYSHGDKVKKAKTQDFVSAVLHGDIVPRSAKEVDTERLAMASIGLDAIANRRTGEEQVSFYGEGAEERYVKSMNEAS